MASPSTVTAAPFPHGEAAAAMLCMVCQHVMTEPRLICSQGHHMCKGCLDKYLASDNVVVIADLPRCPTCRHTIKRDSYGKPGRPAPIVQNLIHAMLDERAEASREWIRFFAPGTSGAASPQRSWASRSHRSASIYATDPPKYRDADETLRTPNIDTPSPAVTDTTSPAASATPPVTESLPTSQSAGKNSSPQDAARLWLTKQGDVPTISANAPAPSPGSTAGKDLTPQVAARSLLTKQGDVPALTANALAPTVAQMEAECSAAAAGMAAWERQFAKLNGRDPNEHDKTSSPRYREAADKVARLQAQLQDQQDQMPHPGSSSHASWASRRRHTPGAMPPPYLHPEPEESEPEPEPQMQRKPPSSPPLVPELSLPELPPEAAELRQSPEGATRPRVRRSEQSSRRSENRTADEKQNEHSGGKRGRRHSGGDGGGDGDRGGRELRLAQLPPDRGGYDDRGGYGGDDDRGGYGDRGGDDRPRGPSGGGSRPASPPRRRRRRRAHPSGEAGGSPSHLIGRWLAPRAQPPTHRVVSPLAKPPLVKQISRWLGVSS
eukprot:Transcript_5136.p1 GENE.Transcript_5136~~Transcript_5136.p1  ORF type:complete len:606 (+),score=7.87 Transcript_5136:171-1820(+)